MTQELTNFAFLNQVRLDNEGDKCWVQTRMFSQDHLTARVYDDGAAVSLTDHNLTYADGKHPEILVLADTLKTMIETLRACGMDI